MAKKKPNKKSSKKKLPKKPYLKGKPLSKKFKEQVRQFAIHSDVDISTEYKFRKFYYQHKEILDNYFYGSIELKPKSASGVIDEFTELSNKGYKFYVITNGKKKEVSANQAKYEIALTENWLNTVFDATGTEFGYKIFRDGRVEIKLPKREKNPDYIDESMEVLVDYFIDEFNIVVYLSEPSISAKYEQNKKYRDEYETKVRNRIKEHRIKSKTKKKSRIKRK